MSDKGITLYNSELINKIKDIDNRLFNIESARQYYVGDWYELDPSDFAVDVSTGTPVIEIIDHRDEWINYFNIGTKLRVKQGTTYSYAFVIDIIQGLIGGDPDSIALVIGGSTLGTSTIVNIAISNRATPDSFPDKFNTQPTIYNDSSVDITSDFSISNWWYNVYGTLVVGNFEMYGNITTSTSYIRVEYPVLSTLSGVTGGNMRQIIYATSSGFTSTQKISWLWGVFGNDMKIEPVDSSLSYSGSTDLRGNFTYFLK